jgi:hypothetical protein
MITVTLFTKPGCGLCDDVKAELDALQPYFPAPAEQNRHLARMLSCLKNIATPFPWCRLEMWS